jgi:hypothetical protein
MKKTKTNIESIALAVGNHDVAKWNLECAEVELWNASQDTIEILNTLGVFAGSGLGKVIGVKGVGKVFAQFKLELATAHAAAIDSTLDNSKKRISEFMNKLGYRERKSSPKTTKNSEAATASAETETETPAPKWGRTKAIKVKISECKQYMIHDGTMYVRATS